MQDLIKIIGNFKNKNILVIGDVMLDKYIWGDVERISPEAPVQIVEVTDESYSPGGAANVANNIAALGSKVIMVGIVGNDTTKDELVEELKKRGIDVSGLIVDESKRTIRKVRVFGKSQQLLRFDYEKKGYVGKATENKILDFLKGRIKSVDAVIVSDYAKGVVTRALMEKLKELCKENSKSIVVDPKPKNKEFYRNVDLITPNHSEAHSMAGIQEEGNAREDVESLGNRLLKDLDSNILITRGEKGMSLFEKNGRITHIPTFAKEVYDIIGAGDTSVAALTLALASGASLEESAVIANYAAGIVVGKVGTSTVSIDELKKSIENG
ncbi:D-glycero-beta-D-manno-heptose-7-phosphate kinase [Candidatus Woesearchaeota archaeon]|nr:D-glycero-beta-D-manno-heptose-7-phosphate kinase [Candidatus Woesearchaeota archaeon]